MFVYKQCHDVKYLMNSSYYKKVMSEKSAAYEEDVRAVQIIEDDKQVYLEVPIMNDDQLTLIKRKILFNKYRCLKEYEEMYGPMNYNDEGYYYKGQHKFLGDEKTPEEEAASTDFWFNKWKWTTPYAQIIEDEHDSRMLWKLEIDRT